MGNLVSDGAEFSCNFCTSKLKLSVIKSSASGDSKKLANQANCLLPPPGGNCTFPPGAPPVPCTGVPLGCVISTGQTVVKIDGQTALGEGCKFLCPKGQPVSLSNAGQTVAKHDEASVSAGAYIAGGLLVVGGVALAICLLPEEAAAAVAVGAAAAAKAVGKVAVKTIKKIANKTKNLGKSKPPANAKPIKAANDNHKQPANDNYKQPANDNDVHGFSGNKRVQYKNASYQKTRNSPAVIENRPYSGHALDQMQNRGIPPSAVENTLKAGSPSERIVKGKMTTNYYDKTNNLTVVVSDKGNIITVGHGQIGR